MGQGIDSADKVAATEDVHARVYVEVDDQYGDMVGMEETLLRGTGTHIRYRKLACIGLRWNS